jgi:hypothetical protein
VANVHGISAKGGQSSVLTHMRSRFNAVTPCTTHSTESKASGIRPHKVHNPHFPSIILVTSHHSTNISVYSGYFNQIKLAIAVVGARPTTIMAAPHAKCTEYDSHEAFSSNITESAFSSLVVERVMIVYTLIQL